MLEATVLKVQIWLLSIFSYRIKNIFLIEIFCGVSRMLRGVSD